MKYDPDHRLIAEIEPFLRTHPRAVLEIGCGDGSLSASLARLARNYVAIDPDEEAIRKAQELASHADFQIGTGEALDFAEASFDVVIFILSLHHQNSRIALAEAHRVLTQEGRLIVLEPSAEGELQQFFHLFKDESEALTEAATALSRSPFQLTARHTFDVLAEFDGPEDLCAYPFDRSIADPADRIRILGKLQQLRGSCGDAQAIQLLDTIHRYSLRKALAHE